MAAIVTDDDTDTPRVKQAIPANADPRPKAKETIVIDDAANTSPLIPVTAATFKRKVMQNPAQDTDLLGLMATAEKLI